MRVSLLAGAGEPLIGISDGRRFGRVEFVCVCVNEYIYIVIYIYIYIYGLTPTQSLR